MVVGDGIPIRHHHHQPSDQPAQEDTMTDNLTDVIDSPAEAERLNCRVEAEQASFRALSRRFDDEVAS